MKLFDDDRFYIVLCVITLVLGFVLDVRAGSPVVRIMGGVLISTILVMFFYFPLPIAGIILSKRRYGWIRSLFNVFAGAILSTFAIGVLSLVAPLIVEVSLGIRPIYWLITLFLLGQEFFNWFSKRVASEVTKQQSITDNSLEWLDEL